MENEELNLFEHAPISKAVLKNAIPAIVSMIMVLIYNLADTFFVGQTHNDLMVAAVSLATPVFLLFMAFGTLFGVGGTSVISRALGQGKVEYAKKVSSFCFWASVAVGFVFIALVLIFINPILALIGCSPDTFDLTRQYLVIVAIGAPFVLIANCFSNIVRAEGKSTEAMVGMLVGNLANVILDPIMILTFKWGVAGAAIATVIGNVLGALYYIYLYVAKKSILTISPKSFAMGERILTGVLAIGIPAALSPILINVAHIVLNIVLAGAGDMAIAGIGVATKIILIVALVEIGLGSGVQPLLGYCAGARKWDRFKGVFRYSLIFATIVGFAMTGLCYLGARPIIKAFLTDAAAVDYGTQFAYILLLSGPFLGALFVLMNALQAMGAAMPSLILSVSRQGIIFYPALWIMNRIFGMYGLIAAQPVADALSLILGAVLFIRITRKLKREDQHKVAMSKA